ncbi:MAG: undecaprenyl-diphosphate phosphatase [Candidatus Gastranaerophilales bacterium]|nr:undecaprenyl-diphosphate phosphatase [Candidatus Gastranaerophilales bacterium]
MTLLHTVLLAIIQGLTEFLPVSSSAHLVLTSSLYKIISGQEFLQAGEEEIFTDIILHLGTLLAVVFFFRKDIMKIIKAFINACKTKDFSSLESKMPLYMVIGTFFTVIIAFPLHEYFENMVSAPEIVGICLIITGFILFLSEHLSKKTQNDAECNKITLKQSILIGIAQGIAACPGISRSGMTICAGLMTGLNRVAAARYSFLLSILIILGASVFYPVLKLDSSEIAVINWTSIIVGFFTAFVVGYLCVKFFMAFLSRFSMKCFAYYCWIVGLCAIIFFGFISK